MTGEGNTRTGSRAVQREQVNRVLLAVLCIFGILALLLTMYFFGHPRPEPRIGMSAPDHSASASFQVVASPTEADVGSADSAIAWASSDSTRGDLTCAILGVSCMLVLLALLARIFLACPTTSRIRRISAALVRLRFVRQRPSIRPSLIELSISRT